MAYQTGFLRNAAGIVVTLTAIIGFTATALGSEKKIKYSLLPLGTSSPILVPATNTPISLTGVQTITPFQGTGQSTLLRGGSPQVPILLWNSVSFASGITKSFAFGGGTTIVPLDFSGNVVVSTSSVTQIVIRNLSATSSAAGVVTLIW